VLPLARRFNYLLAKLLLYGDRPHWRREMLALLHAGGGVRIDRPGHGRFTQRELADLFDDYGGGTPVGLLGTFAHIRDDLEFQTGGGRLPVPRLTDAEVRASWPALRAGFLALYAALAARLADGKPVTGAELAERLTALRAATRPG
jgi:hypothetical protein